jgi:hypothetical protein
MKPASLISLSPLVALTLCCCLSALLPPAAHAAPDAAIIDGDLKVDAIHFSTDGSVQSQACPWSYNGANIGFLSGNVGIGTLTPAASLDVDGTVKATQFSGDGSGLANIWKTTGNAGTTPGTQFIGTTDTNALEIKVNNQRAIRVEPGATGVTPNIVAGNAANSAGSFDGAAVAGGGRAGTDCLNPDTGQHTRSCPNFALGDFAVIGGGLSNTASAAYNTICGGLGNTASGISYNTVAGGRFNTANGNSSTVAGGYYNTASGNSSTVSGGYDNQASNDYSTVAGGYGSEARGYYSIVVGGFQNIAGGRGSLAAGTNAWIRDAVAAGNTYGDEGTFLWSDAHGAFFHSITANEFAARALGGFRFVTAIDGTGAPTSTFTISPAGDVSPAGKIDFGAVNGQKISFWSGAHGLGVQTLSTYFRSSSDYYWYKGGVHSNAQGDPGTGGTTLMKLTSGGLWVNGTLASTSDRNAKENFGEVDAAAVLQKVAELPVQTWNYRDDAQKAKHIGPMAQDFAAAFGVGADDRQIATVDADGVALAAIKALKAENDALRAKSEALKTESENLKARLARLESMMGL